MHTILVNTILIGAWLKAVNETPCIGFNAELVCLSRSSRQFSYNARVRPTMSSTCRRRQRLGNYRVVTGGGF